MSELKDQDSLTSPGSTSGPPKSSNDPIAFGRSVIRPTKERGRDDASVYWRGADSVNRRRRSGPQAIATYLARWFIARGLRLAIKCLSRGWTDRAVSILQGLVAIAPRVVLLRIWLARAALANYDDATAEEAIRGSDVNDLPRVANHHCRLAQLHLALENFNAAAQYLLLAERAGSNSAVVWKLRGRLHEFLGEIDQAAACFQREFDLEPSKRLKARALLFIAECYADAGRVEASSIYRKVIEFTENFTYQACAYYGLMMCRPRALDLAPLLEDMRHLISSPRVTRLGKSYLHFAMGMLYDQTGEVGMAYSHFMLGNNIVESSGGKFSLTNLQSNVEARTAVFDADLITKLSQYGCEEDFLICIVGMPRSGTSLAEQILAGHHDVRGLGERVDIYCLTQRLHKEMGGHDIYPYCCKRLSPRDVRKWATRIRDRLRRIAGPCSHIVTKRPGDVWELGLLKILFPNSRFIHMQRAPVDTCWSCYIQNFDNVPYSTDLDMLSSVYECYQRMVGHWHQNLPPGSILDVSYESLVTDPESTVRLMSEFCGLPFQQSSLEFYRHNRPVRTMSRQQVRQPIYRSSVGRSNRYRELLGPLLRLEGRPMSGF